MPIGKRNRVLPNGKPKTPALPSLNFVLRFGGIGSGTPSKTISKRLDELQKTCARLSFPKLPNPNLPSIDAHLFISVPEGQLETVKINADIQEYELVARPNFSTRGEDWQYIETSFTRPGFLTGISDADFRGFTVNGYIAGVGPHIHDDSFEIASLIGHSMRIMENAPEIGVWGFPTRIQNESCVSGINRPYHPMHIPTPRAFNPKGLLFIRWDSKAPGEYLYSNFLEDVSRPLAEAHAGGQAGVCKTVSRMWYGQSLSGTNDYVCKEWKKARAELVKKYGKEQVDSVVKEKIKE
jgi:hypothetical protein